MSEIFKVDGSEFVADKMAEMVFGPGAEGLKDPNLVIKPITPPVIARAIGDALEVEIGDRLLGC